MKTATLLHTGTSETGAEQRFYRLDPPLQGHKYVLVSAVEALFTGPETYIFPADKRGEVTDWGELEGSYRGGLDHHEALMNVGYEDFREESL